MTPRKTTDPRARHPYPEPRPAAKGRESPRVAELRVAWGLVGLLAAAAFLPERRGIEWWALLVGAPWLAGALVLARRIAAANAGRAIGASFGSREGRFAWILVGALPLWTGLVFGAAAAAYAVLVLGAGLLLLAGTGRPKRFRARLAATTLAVSATSAGALAAEFLLRHLPGHPWIAEMRHRERLRERYDRLWERNLFGLRSPYERIAKDGDEFRIVILGDSFSWGEGIPDTRDTWPARLEQRLRRSCAKHRLAVINMARRGFTTANQAELLRRLGWQFEPDAVVVQYLVNDVLPSGPHFAREGEDLVFPTVSLVPARFRRGLVRSSYLLRFVEHMAAQWRRGPEPHRNWFPLYADTATGWRQFRAALHEIGDSARARRVPVFLLVHPSFVPGRWTAESHPFAVLYEQVRELADSLGFRVLDATPVFAARGRDGRDWWVSPLDAHPNTEAHGLVARFVHDQIVADPGLASSLGCRAEPASRPPGL